MAPLWFLAQLSFNFSLGLTSVTSNTILSSTSSLFTYAAAIALRQDAFQLQKVGAIGLCMAGMPCCLTAACSWLERLWCICKRTADSLSQSSHGNHPCWQ